jgi:dTDP-4-dehydrorhamnose reductase
MGMSVQVGARSVLLTGSRGQLGSDLRKKIMQDRPDWTVISPTRVELDLLQPLEPQLARFPIRSRDLIVNCAALHKLEEAEAQPRAAFRINAYAVRDLAQWCLRHDAHFVHISTDYVFGASSMRRPYREEDPPGPMNVCGASKLLGESLLSSEEGSWTVCRVASLFGVAGSSGKGGNFVETILSKARQGARLTVVDNRFMSPTSTEDVAMAILAVADLRLLGIYHTVNSGSVSWWEFAAQVLRTAGFADYPIDRRQDDVADELPPIRPLYTSLDNAKLAAARGCPMPDWQDALERYLLERK